jgi:hypothetical protein
LPVILGEVLAVGPASKKVRRHILGFWKSWGRKLEILRHVPCKPAQEAEVLLAHGIDRMRREVHIAGVMTGFTARFASYPGRTG